MNQKMKYITGIVLSVLVICALTIPVFALTESDVQSQVSASGKEGVAGNLFVWFLCAVAFLKISQKIDSFMQGLGINVGHTGGSMLAEAMLAARSIAAARGVAGRGRGGNAGRGGSTGGSGGDSNTFLQGGLAGVANRSFYNGAYTNHYEAKKLRDCKASAHVPEWRKKSTPTPKPEQTKRAPRPNKIPVKRSEFVKTDKDSIMSTKM